MEFPKVIHYGAITDIGKAEMRTEDFIQPGPEDVVVKMNICNICTNDYQRFNGSRKQNFPMAAGHECSGIIVWKGENVSPYLEVGMQVSNYVGGCGVCYNCRTGNQDQCTGKIRVPEPYYDGAYGRAPGARGFSDYMVVSQNKVVPVSNDIAPECAAFLEPFSAALHGQRKAHVMPCEDVVVLGAGTMGLVNAQVAKALGARVIITELDPYKLNRAREMGGCDVIDSKNSDAVAEVKRLTGGKGADLVIPCVGLTVAYKQAYEMMKKECGRFLIYSAGYPAPQFADDMKDANTIHYKKIDIFGTIGANGSDCVDAARMISNKLVHPEFILQENGRIPLRDFQKAMELASTPGTYRVSVDLQEV